MVRSDYALGVAPLEGTYRLDDFSAELVANHRRGLTQSCDDIERDSTQNAAVWKAIDIRAYASVPLVRDCQLVATFYVNFREPHRWTKAELELVEEVAARTWEAVERARAEADLRELNATLEMRVIERTAERDRMWETSPDLMLVIDFDGVFRRVNPAWTKLLGYTSEELIGHHVNDFVVTDDHCATVSAYESAAVGGNPKMENRYRHKDSSVR